MKNERGFTLIELLVVIAILAVLFGVTALALNGVGDDAEAAAASGELDVVQTAIDVCDALNSCTDVSAAQNSHIQVGPSTANFGTYLRRTSKFYYSWNATGVITGQKNSSGTVFFP